MLEFYMELFSGQNKIYLRSLIVYTLLITIIIFISSAIYIYSSNKALKNEILRTREQQLMLLQIYLDETIVNDVQKILLEEFILNTENSVLSDFLLKDTNNTYNYWEVHNKISDMLYKNSIISDVSVYNYEKDTFISVEAGLNLNYYEKKIPTVWQKYQHILDSAEDSSDRNGWLSTSSSGKETAHVDILVFFQKIPFLSTTRWKNNLISFHLDLKKIVTNSKLLIDKESSFSIFYKEILLFTSEISGNIAERYSDETLKYITTTESGTYFQRITDPEAVLWVSSKSGNWKYILNISMKHLNETVNTSRKIILIEMFVILLISLIAIGLVTRTFYKPVSRIAGAIRVLAQKRGKNIQFSKADLYIKQLDQDISNMEEIIDKNKGINKYRFFLDTINGHVKSREETMEEATLADINLTYDNIGLFIIEIDKEYLLSITLKERELLTHEIRTSINSFFSQKGSYSLCFVHPGRFIPILFKSYACKSEMDEAKQLLDTLKDFGHFNIGIGEWDTDMTSIHGTYQKTFSFFQYTFLYGYGNIYETNIIDKYESSHFEFERDSQINYRKMLKTNDFEGINKNINETIDLIIKSEYSISSCKDFLLQVIVVLSKVVQESGANSSEFDFSVLRTEFEQIENLTKVKEWLFFKIQMFSRLKITSNDKIQYNFIENVKAYIEENIDSQISLDSIAEHFAISQSHLSKLFKDYSTQSFGEYLKRLKIEQAAKLLSYPGKLSISEIAASLGYYTPSYFSRIFKEVYGMTPAQYQRKHLK